MKQLKKHPKQQRMEDMKIPGSKYVVGNHNSTSFEVEIKKYRRGTKCFHHPSKPAVLQSGTAEANLCQECLDRSISKDKVIWEGREYLRSINREHDYFKDYWRFLAGLILIGSIVASAYILSHRLVCAPASFEGKTVINCVRK